MLTALRTLSLYDLKFFLFCIVVFVALLCNIRVMLLQQFLEDNETQC